MDEALQAIQAIQVILEIMDKVDKVDKAVLQAIQVVQEQPGALEIMEITAQEEQQGLVAEAAQEVLVQYMVLVQSQGPETLLKMV
jgi:hypothetical protein